MTLRRRLLRFARNDSPEREWHAKSRQGENVSATPDTISIRPLGPDDSVEALTDLLHRAYAALGAMGLNYIAVDQTSQVTRRRIAGGVCLVAVGADGRIVGTALFKAPGLQRGSPWLERPEV